jgi:hypothetical protein
MNTMLRSLLGAALAAALLTPASAIAAPHWSSPVKVAGPAADPPGIATPKAFVAGGQSLAVFSDGLRPALATGTVAGAFSAPAALGADASGSGGVDAALGAGGTLAVAWTTGGTAHVAVGPAGQRGTQTDLPGANVSDVAVAVAPDGTVTVAYRTKPAVNSFELLAATAAPGAAFGPPVTLHTSSQGIDALDAAAGPDGAVAIAYRRLAPRYRAYAVVRPAGAAAFGEPQSLSSGALTDIATRIAFEADGTIVSAWTNQGGASYAVRAPGAAAFAAPAPLGPAGEQTFLIDLAPTQQGGTVAAWSAAGQVKAAVKTPGGGFGEAQNVLPANSSIAVQPVVTAQPGGPMTVAASDPATGAVKAADLGGGSTTIGYGPVEAAPPLAIASAHDRTVVLWRDASGSLSASTRSEQAPASGGPGQAPAAADKTAPKLTLLAPRRISVTRRTKSISFYVRCDEPCTLEAVGNMRTTRGKKRIVSPLRFYKTKKLGAGRRLVRLGLFKSTQNDLRKALAKKRGATVFFDITAADAASNSARKKGQLTLRAAKQKRR